MAVAGAIILGAARLFGLSGKAWLTPGDRHVHLRGVSDRRGQGRHSRAQRRRPLRHRGQPVIAKCCDHALKIPELYGIWGAMTARERARAMSPRRPPRDGAVSASPGSANSGSAIALRHAQSRTATSTSFSPTRNLGPNRLG
jgi:hypothetical protein